jgi:hypothetical protein
MSVPFTKMNLAIPKNSAIAKRTATQKRLKINFQKKSFNI